jgi:hypothetical protein
MSRYVKKYPETRTIICSFCGRPLKTKQWNKEMHGRCNYLKTLQRAKDFNRKHRTRTYNRSSIMNPAAIREVAKYSDRSVVMDFSIGH